MSFFSRKSHLQLGINYLAELWRGGQGSAIDNTVVLAGTEQCVLRAQALLGGFSQGTD